MNLDFLNKEISFTGNKKDTYPTKKTINLYYKEDKTTRPSTIALYVIFFVVVGAFAAKLLIFDLAAELNQAERQLASKEAYLEEQLEALQEYNDISSQYSRYSSSYLRPDEMIQDRMVVLKMLEETVFNYKDTKFLTLTITENLVSLEFVHPNLYDASEIKALVETYTVNGEVLVVDVDVDTASYDEGDIHKYYTHMIIELESLVEEETTGGEQ
ncbi:MAG: hypothetical protein IJ958_09975 [Agathobacter sp.]|nr:hypothetical protein [Agathobacter sp.]